MNRLVITLIGIIAGLVYLFSIYTYIKNLESKIESKDKELVLARTSLDSCMQSVNKQNEEINRIKIDKELKEQQLQEYLNQEPEIKYETIYKEIPKITYKSNSCEYIQEVLNSLKGKKL